MIFLIVNLTKLMNIFLNNLKTFQNIFKFQISKPLRVSCITLKWMYDGEGWGPCHAPHMTQGGGHYLRHNSIVTSYFSILLSQLELWYFVLLKLFFKIWHCIFYYVLLYLLPFVISIQWCLLFTIHSYCGATLSWSTFNGRRIYSTPPYAWLFMCKT